jgi:hypothetical protein
MNPIDHARHLMAYRTGQSDAYLRDIMATSPIEAQASVNPIALRMLRRLWLQYREDRGYEGPASLLSTENFDQRSGFISAITFCMTTLNLPGQQQPSDLHQAIQVALATFPPGEDFSHNQTDLNADDFHLLGDVQANIAQTLTANHYLPDDHLQKLLSHYLYTNDPTDQPKPTKSPCWALNLVVALNAQLLGLTIVPLPLPGIFRRELFRANRSDTWRRFTIVRNITKATESMMTEAIDLTNAQTTIDLAFPQRRSSSRIHDVFQLVSGLGELGATQVSRAMDISQPGARKLLLQLERGGFLRRTSSGTKWNSTVGFRLGPPKHSWLSNDKTAWLDESHENFEEHMLSIQPANTVPY